MASSGPAIGIDLGTTYSVVGVWRNRKAEIVANNQSATATSRTTPSVVAFVNGEWYIGDAAKEVLDVTNDGRNILYDSKRLIGKRFDEVEATGDLRMWPFTVRNDGGVPKYNIANAEGNTTLMSPEEVSSKILEVMKKLAEENCLETAVKQAVITVPAYFNDAQRKATVSAAKIAGLEVLGLLNEPAAAAIAYGFGKGKKETVLIFDLGGGTFDLSVVEVWNDKLKVLAYDGDLHLGGQDFDAQLLEFVMKDVKKTLDYDIGDDPEALHGLKNACEIAKKRLSQVLQAKIVTFFNKINKGYEKSFSRVQFEEMCLPKFKMAIDMLPKLFEKANMKKEDIDEVVLVGGSTNIPKVKQMVKEFFGGMELKTTVNPDEAVAQGAAIFAAKLTGQGGAKGVRLQEVASLNLGVATSNGQVAVMIPRGAQLPCTMTKIFTTTDDGQERAEIKVYQGIRPNQEDNHPLGYLTLDIPARSQGEVIIEITFDINDSGLLKVSAVEESTKEKQEMDIQSEAKLTDREVCEIMAKAEKHKSEDDEAREQARRDQFRL